MLRVFKVFYWLKWVVPGFLSICISFLGVGNVGLGLAGFDRVLPSFTGFSFECVGIFKVFIG